MSRYQNVKRGKDKRTVVAAKHRQSFDVAYTSPVCATHHGWGPLTVYGQEDTSGARLTVW